MHALQTPVNHVDQPHLQYGGGHQYGGANVDVVKLVGAEKQQDGEKVDQYFHEGLKFNEAEFMQ
jgi:hypothetical protein